MKDKTQGCHRGTSFARFDETTTYTFAAAGTFAPAALGLDLDVVAHVDSDLQRLAAYRPS